MRSNKQTNSIHNRSKVKKVGRKGNENDKAMIFLNHFNDFASLTCVQYVQRF